MKARIQGIASQMNTFRYLFGLLLSELVLRHVDKLSQTIRSPDLSSVEGKEIAMLTVKTLQSIRSDTNFDLFWKKVEQKRTSFEVEEPTLPRKRKVPRLNEIGTGAGNYPSTALDLYRQIYFEVLDLAINSITARFDQAGYKIYSSIEQLLFKAVINENYEEELARVSKFYEGDLDYNNLESELRVLRELYAQKGEGERTSIQVLKRILQSLTPTQAMLINEVYRLSKYYSQCLLQMRHLSALLAHYEE